MTVVAIKRAEFAAFVAQFGFAEAPRPAGRPFEELRYEKIVRRAPEVKAVIWSSISPRTGVSRGYGKDAIRIQLRAGDVLLASGIKTCRTRRWRFRLGKRLRELLAEEMVQEATRRLVRATQKVIDRDEAEMNRLVQEAERASEERAYRSKMARDAACEKANETLIEKPQPHQTKVVARVVGELAFVSGPGTFPARKALRAFGLEWNGETRTWSGPARTAEDRAVLKQQFAAAGIEVRAR